MVKGRKQREMWLTSALLILIVLYSLSTLQFIYISSRETEGLMNSYVLGTTILGLIQLIGLILIFKWKKLGAYLYIAVNLTSIVTGFITSSTFILSAIMNMVVSLIILGILYFLICPMWNSME
ncbi:hypothetical protein [Clostridium sp.]